MFMKSFHLPLMALARGYSEYEPVLDYYSKNPDTLIYTADRSSTVTWKRSARQYFNGEATFREREERVQAYKKEMERDPGEIRSDQVNEYAENLAKEKIPGVGGWDRQTIALNKEMVDGTR